MNLRSIIVIFAVSIYSLHAQSDPRAHWNYELEIRNAESQRLALGEKLNALQNQQNVLSVAIYNLQNTRQPSTYVPGETQEERQARHQAICDAINRQAQADYDQQHPFSPSGAGWHPNIDQSVYDDAVSESDKQLAQQIKDQQEQERQRAMEEDRRQQLELQKQIIDLQQQIVALEAENQKLEKEKADAYKQKAKDYNRQFSASEAKAAELYDFANDPKSAGGKRMIEIDDTLRANGDPLYDDPNKPLIVAQMVAKEMGIAPKSDKSANTKP